MDKAIPDWARPAGAQTSVYDQAGSQAQVPEDVLVGMADHVNHSPARMTAAKDAVEAASARFRDFLVNNMSYYRLHLLWFILVGHIGAIAMYCIEGYQYTYIDCLFQVITPKGKLMRGHNNAATDGRS